MSFHGQACRPSARPPPAQQAWPTKCHYLHDDDDDDHYHHHHHHHKLTPLARHVAPADDALLAASLPRIGHAAR